MAQSSALPTYTYILITLLPMPYFLPQDSSLSQPSSPFPLSCLLFPFFPLPHFLILQVTTNTSVFTVLLARHELGQLLCLPLYPQFLSRRYIIVNVQK